MGYNAPVIVRRYFQSLAGCAWFFAGGFLLPRYRHLLYRLSLEFGFESQGRPRPKPTVPACPQTDFPGRDGGEGIRLEAVSAVDGNISLTELVVISSLIRRVGPRRSFEIGTFDGRTTLNLAANSPQGSEVLTLDLSADQIGSVLLELEKDDTKYVLKHSPGERFRGHPLSESIRQLEGDSATFDFTPFQGTCQFVFVDGSHSYDYVRADSETAYSLLAPAGGIIVWHDYDTPSWPGVTRALNELQAGDERFRGLRRIDGTSLCLLDATVSV